MTTAHQKTSAPKTETTNQRTSAPQLTAHQKTSAPKTETTNQRTFAPKFQALEVALEIIRSLRELVARIQRGDPKLATQIRDAASSIPGNLAEGSRRRGKDRAYFYRVAAGSADETRIHLHTAEAWGYVTMGEIECTLQLLDRELAMLWRLTE